MVGALLLALIALGRTLALSSPSRCKPGADRLSTRSFPSFFPQNFFDSVLLEPIFRSRTFIVLLRTSDIL